MYSASTKQHGVQCTEALYLVERYLKTESFKMTQSEYSQRFVCPALAVVWKFVKQFR
jgi:hypothetical protein